jgi:hypothetical protein
LPASFGLAYRLVLLALGAQMARRARVLVPA